jgi:hypothetical protein
MKTSQLEEYVKQLPSGEEVEAMNEWNRRRVTRHDGRMKDWNDAKLDGYITMLRADALMLNDKECERLQQNMMVTRGVRQKSNEKMIEQLEADTEELRFEVSDEVDRYKATLDSEKVEKNHLKLMAEVKSTRKVKGELSRALKEKRVQEREDRRMLKEQLKTEKENTKQEKESMRIEDAVRKE